MEFKVRFGFLGRLLMEKAIKTRMQQTVHVIAAAMAEYYESGTPLTEARIKELQKTDFEESA